jgi:hypothetical protein
VVLQTQDFLLDHPFLREDQLLELSFDVHSFDYEDVLDVHGHAVVMIMVD